MPTDKGRSYKMPYPTLAYCHVIWGSTTKQNMHPLLIPQKEAVRIITKVPWYTHTHYFIDYNILSITEPFHQTDMPLQSCSTHK